MMHYAARRTIYESRFSHPPSQITIHAPATKAARNTRKSTNFDFRITVQKRSSISPLIPNYQSLGTKLKEKSLLATTYSPRGLPPKYHQR